MTNAERQRGRGAFRDLIHTQTEARLKGLVVRRPPLSDGGRSLTADGVMTERILWIRNKTALKNVIEVLKAVPVDGSMEIVIQKYNPDHSDAQRRLAWVLLGQIAQYIPDKSTGELHCKEYWHHLLKLHFGYVAETIPVKIEGKWVDVPQPKSLSSSASNDYRMSKEEVGDYITQLEQFMAERGVIPERVA